LTEGSIDTTDPEAWLIVDGKLYLVYSQETLAKWERNPSEYIRQANANWPKVVATLEQ
jgi:hypothetical protein